MIFNVSELGNIDFTQVQESFFIKKITRYQIKVTQKQHISTLLNSCFHRFK